MPKNCPECDAPMELLGVDGGAVWQCTECDHAEEASDDDGEK